MEILTRVCIYVLYTTRLTTETRRGSRRRTENRSALVCEIEAENSVCEPADRLSAVLYMLGIGIGKKSNNKNDSSVHECKN